jgi:glyoxylase-like metal-dependent hydrolase (beta-lactamase superfamily II)
MDGWQVGRAKITPIVEVETLTSPRFLFKGLDKAGVKAVAEQAPWLTGSFVDDDGYLLQRIQCLVIEIDGSRIAVDTCVGNNLQLPFLDDLASAGFSPDSIDAVVCTHLHVDHVGWNTMLVDGQWVPTFPNARYIFTKPELEYWQATAYPDGDNIFADSVAPIVDAGRADLVAVDHRLDGGVRLDSTPGHTPGHVSVVIESEGQQAVITGDMIHTPIQIADIELSSVFDYDQRAAADTRRHFLARYADGALVIGTHWGGPGAGRIQAEGDGRWRIEPAPAAVG